MDASEITDRDTLQAWLETRPQADSIAIAQRCALRVVPNPFARVRVDDSLSFGLIALPTLRSLLTAGAAQNASTPTLIATARAAARASSTTVSAARADYAVSSSDVADAAARTAFAASASDAIYAAARTVDALDAANAAIAATFDLYQAGGQSDFSANMSDVWAGICQDALSLQSGTILLSLPLWHNSPPPDWFTTASAAMRSFWQTNNPTHWAFWQRWYDAATQGRPLDWQLQHDIALIPDAIWQSGPGPVAEAISRIEEEHQQRKPENPLTTELGNQPKPSASQIASTQAAMEQNRTMLPPTFDAMEGLILLEIERLQQRNYTDDLDQAEALRQIRIFVTLYDAICALRGQLPATTPVTEEQAEKSVSLVSLYTKKFADLPRTKADEVIEGFWSTGREVVQASLIGTTTLLGVSYGLPAIAAVTIGAMVFAPKNAVELVKAAREAIAPKP